MSTVQQPPPPVPPVRPRRRRVVLAGAVVLALVAAAGFAGVRWWQAAHRSPLVKAMALAPADTQRYLWTDWAEVRRQLDAPLSADSSTEELQEMLTAGYARDLSSASAMVDSATGLHEFAGFSPATADWELFAQGHSGALSVVQLTEEVTEESVEAALERAGYVRDGELWDGADVQSGIGVSPEFSYVVLREGRVYAGDSRTYLARALEGGSEPDRAVEAAAAALPDPVSALVYTGDYACGELALSGADENDEAQGEELVRQAGGVAPLSSYAMGTTRDGDVRVVLGFEDHDQAVRDADARAALASGPAPGQGGDFADRFELGEVRATDALVTMELEPVEGAYVLSDLSSGPVLFAAC